MEDNVFVNVKDKLISFKEKYQKSQNFMDEKLFEAFDLFGLKFKNKFCFINLTDDFLYDFHGVKKERLYEFYERFLNSNLGLICMGGVYPKLKGMKDNSVILNDENTEKIFGEFVKKMKVSGSKIFFSIKSNLSHYSNKNKFMNIFPYSASFNVSYSDSAVRCIRISDQKCNEMIDEFVRLSLFAKNTGFDGLFIDGGLNGMLGEFSSCEFNKRSFGYFAERKELAIKLLNKISSQCLNFPIIYKINLLTFIHEVFKDNQTEIRSLKNIRDYALLKEQIIFLEELVRAGVDGFMFDFGLKESEFLSDYNPFQDTYLFYAVCLEIKKHFQNHELKNKFNEPVAIVYDDNLDLTEKEHLVSEFDFVNITKNIYADINFASNQKTQNSCKICIKCGICEHFAEKYGVIDCLINENLTTSSLKKVSENKKKNIAVIGAGLSGIVCANTLAERGYKVDLFEGNSKINKTGELIEIYGCDKYLKNYNKYLKQKLNSFIQNKQIDIYFNENCKFSAEKFSKYQTIVVATGFKEKLLNIVGANQKHVKSVYDVLSSKKHIDNVNNIAIYAKSELSLKLALYLSTQKKNVSLIIGNVNFLFNMPNSKMTYYLYAIKNLNIKTHLMAHIKKIHEDSAEVVVNSTLKNKDVMAVVLNMKSKTNYKFVPQIKTVDADLFVYEPNLVSNNKFYYDAATENFKGELYMVGNSLAIGSMYDDIKTGFFVGKNI